MADGAVNETPPTAKQRGDDDCGLRRDDSGPNGGHSSDISDDSDSCDSDGPLGAVSPAGKSPPRPRDGSLVISPQNRVTVLNFGTVNLTGTTSGVEFGNKTEYLGPVTVQQIVHGGGDALVGSDADPHAASLRSRAKEMMSGEACPRRTGILGRRSEGRGGHGEGGKRRGNGLLWKHLLGKKVNTATWLPVMLVSCFSFIVMIVDTFILARLTERDNAELSPSLRLVSKTQEYAEEIRIPPISRKIHENLPKLHRSVIVSRSTWNAIPPKEEYTPLEHPVEYVIISHTATEPCSNLEECSMHVNLVQKFHVESRQWNDIGYNFLIGGDGNSYEGRGWEYVGAHAKGYNMVSIGISFIGTFTNISPPPAQIRACKLLIKEGVSLGKIASNYKLIGHRQVSSTESPGEKLYEELQNWEHWSPEVT